MVQARVYVANAGAHSPELLLHHSMILKAFSLKDIEGSMKDYFTSLIWPIVRLFNLWNLCCAYKRKFLIRNYCYHRRVIQV